MTAAPRDAGDDVVYDRASESYVFFDRPTGVRLMVGKRDVFKLGAVDGGGEGPLAQRAKAAIEAYRRKELGP